LAVSSGSPVNGSLTLFFFVLGTIPVFFALAYFATKLGEKHQKLFSRIIAIMLIGLSIFTVINGLRLFGINFSSRSSATVSQTQVLDNVSVQKGEIKFNDSSGYTPSKIRLKRGVPAEITLTNDGARGCIRSFVIPDLNKKAIVPASGSTTITFTPTKVGKINFTCSMGMYNGQFIVEE
jgi:plastocyanin domain-containing protein